MFNFIKNLFSTKSLINDKNTGFLNSLKHEKNIDIFIERVNQVLSAHKNT